jgi:hypothetical protein
MFNRLFKPVFAGINESQIQGKPANGGYWLTTALSIQSG